MIYFSPSKINIGLNIVSKREDGYHNLQSIFFPLPFYDIIEIVKSTHFNYKNIGITIDCNIEKNTCYKAYQLLLQDFPFIKNIEILHYKILPTGMGLGAGSANVVAIIQIINQLFNLKISLEKMKSYVEKIGSDCSFFLQQEVAYVYEKGNKINPIPLSLKAYKIILLLPKKITVSTIWAYNKIIPKEATFSLEKISTLKIEQWKYYITNDFEELVFKAYPILKDAKKELYQQAAIYVSMSGSGASLFGIFNKDTKINKDFFNPHFDIKELNGLP